VPPTDPIVADLRAAFRGRLLADPASRGVYSSDASAFSVSPLLVAVPVDEADVVVLVTYCGEHNLSLQARGAGTGLAGESLGPGIAVDLSVHFRGLPVVEGDRVRVRPGTTCAEVNAALAPLGRRIACEPANAAACTIGGMIATDASGSDAAVHGTMRDAVDDLTVVWDSGDVDSLSRADQPRTQEIAQGLSGLLRDGAATIATKRSRAPFDRAGYRLHDVLTPTGVDLRRIVVGSEGTLGLITEAVLKTVPIPKWTTGAVIGFASIDEAAKTGLAIARRPGVVACDLLDRRLTALGKGLAVPGEIEAVLIVTAESDAPDDRRDAFLNDGTLLHGPASDPATLAAIRHFRTTALAAVYAIGAGARPTAIVEDCGVPPEVLPEFLAAVQALFRAKDRTVTLLAHVPMGVVHLLPFADLDRPADRERLWPLADELYGIVRSLGGTMSAQHGVGIARTPWLRSQVGELADVFREVKRIFDPRSLFNPGKIVGPDPTRPAWPLRPVAAAASVPLLQWADSPAAEAAKCNGCGDCRPRRGGERMCPIFKATGLETATPRAKANLARLLADPELADDLPAVRDVAKLCTNCKSCASECRSGVDVPKLMIETKAMLWREHGSTRAGWFLARAESLLGLASFFALTGNALIGTRPGRWLLEKLLGLDRYIRLPSLRYRTFVWRAWTRGWTKRPKNPGAKRIVLFVDPLTNACDPLTGDAAVAVLKHHGADVVVAPKVRPTGLAALTAGDLDTARDAARKTVRMLGPYVRDGYRVVCLDPSAATAIAVDYPSISSDADTLAVAQATVDLSTLLGQWHAAGELRTDFRDQDLTVGHHVPCHQRAMKASAPGSALLALIPGLVVKPIEAGCSGMMGPWGLLTQHRADSSTIGAALGDALADRSIAYGSSECGACRIQMQQLAGKRAVHPVQYLAMAYGLLPEIGRRLVVPLKDRASR
jgi:FAD/FMN-containing dehydrogenase/Fe-S oxidoreductase